MGNPWGSYCHGRRRGRLSFGELVHAEYAIHAAWIGSERAERDALKLQLSVVRNDIAPLANGTRSNSKQLGQRRSATGVLNSVSEFHMPIV